VIACVGRILLSAAFDIEFGTKLAENQSQKPKINATIQGRNNRKIGERGRSPRTCDIDLIHPGQ
jgi:hypothetical protein